MNKSIEILGKPKLERFILALLYGMDSLEKAEEDYEEKIKDSYEGFTAKLEHLYEGVDGEDNRLFDLVADFAEIHEDVYFEIGFLTGVKLLKSLESVYKKDVDISLKAFSDRNILPDGDSSGESILRQFAQARMGTALEEALRKDVKFQESSRKTREALKRVKENMFTKEQWEAIDGVLSENNDKAADYGKMAYQQGALDMFSFLKELYLRT